MRWMWIGIDHCNLYSLTLTGDKNRQYSVFTPTMLNGVWMPIV